MTKRLRICGLAAALWAATPAVAAGGAHLVDDASVETPGMCHIESWYNHATDGGTLQLSPACTPLWLPHVEVGGYLRHGWTDGASATGIGVSAKFALRDEATGLGIALSPSFDFNLNDGRIETVSLIVPFTLPISDALRVNINAGWQWAYIGDIGTGVLGGQAEWTFAPGWGAMVEGVGRTIGISGWQAGLRRTVANGNVDIDLLGGRFTDGVSPTVLTFGVTVRH